MDNLNKQQRSYVMSKIRSKNTKIELKIFRELRKKKVYFKCHYLKAPGTPDIALPSKKKAVFINGDFWHGYSYKNLKNRLFQPYWREKIEKNIKRDKKNYQQLKKNGWSVMKIWEHEIKKDLNSCVDKIVLFLK